MRRSLLLLLFGVYVFQLLANYDSLIVDANKYYADEEYDKAIELYDSVILEYQSPELYYNLANSYYKKKQIRSAILNYERAIRISPGDEDILYNLELTKTHVIDKIDVLPEMFMKRWINSLADIASSDNWAKISLVSFVLFLILFSMYLYVNRLGLKKISFWLSFLLLVVSIFSYSLSQKQKSLLASQKQAIIFAPTVTVKSSPNENGTDLFLLHEGTKVSVRETVGEWREIRLSDGNKGWVKEETIEMI